MKTLVLELWEEINKRKAEIYAVYPNWDGHLPLDLIHEPYATALTTYLNRLNTMLQFRISLAKADMQYIDAVKALDDMADITARLGIPAHLIVEDKRE